METKVLIRTIKNDTEGKVIIFSAQMPCTGIVMKQNFLIWVKDYFSHSCPDTAASYFENPNLDTLSVVVVSGINDIDGQDILVDIQ